MIDAGATILSVLTRVQLLSLALENVNPLLAQHTDAILEDLVPVYFLVKEFPMGKMKEGRNVGK